MRHVKWTLLLLSTLAVACCATNAPLASPDSDAAAKKFEPGRRQSESLCSEKRQFIGRGGGVQGFR